jgi:hypothetical protein
MASLSKVHLGYAALAVGLGVGGFVLGRFSAKQNQTAAIREIASDPKMAEAAHAVAALDDFRKSFQVNGANEADQKAKEKAEKDAEDKKRNDATDTLETPEVRVKVVTVYRGKLNRENNSFGGRGEDKPLDHDCLLVGYRIDNLSKTTVLDASLSNCQDNFGNKLDAEHDYDYRDVLTHLGLTDLNTDKISPGESKVGYYVLKKPLANATCYIYHVYVSKVNGENSDIGYIKALTK